MYSLRELLSDCATRRTRVKGTRPQKLKVYTDTWDALNSWLLDTYLGDHGKGCSLGGFATFGWQITGRGDATVQRPHFQLGRGFVEQYGLPDALKPATGPLAPRIGRCEELNFSKLAIRYSSTLTKDLAFSAIRDVTAQLGRAMRSNSVCKIHFSLGVLHYKERKLEFEWDSQLGERVLDDDPDQVPETRRSAVHESGQEREHDENRSPADGADGEGGAPEGDEMADPATRGSDDDGKQHDATEPSVKLPEIPLAKRPASLGDFSTQRSLSEASFDTDSCSYVSSDDGLFDDVESEFDQRVEGAAQKDAKLLAEEEAFHRHLDDVKRKVRQEKEELDEMDAMYERREQQAMEDAAERQRERAQLQAYVRKQMSEREEARKNERKERQERVPTPHAGINDDAKGRSLRVFRKGKLPEKGDLGAPGAAQYETAAQQKQAQADLRARLRQQIEEKQARQKSEKAAAVEEERRFLQFVHHEMEASKEEVHRKQASKKKEMLQSWNRELKIRDKLREAKKSTHKKRRHGGGGTKRGDVSSRSSLLSSARSSKAPEPARLDTARSGFSAASSVGHDFRASARQ